MMEHGVGHHEHIHHQINDVTDVQHLDDVQQHLMDSHVHHMLSVVPHQKHQHVLMEAGVVRHMDIRHQIRVVADVMDVQQERYQMDELVHHIVLRRIVRIVMIKR